MGIKKKFISLILVVIFIIMDIFIVVGNNEAIEVPETRILFIIDSSFSMNTYDSDRLIPEIIKMFADGSYSSKTEIGFVTYNDRIINTYPFTSMSNIENRNDIKDKVNNISRIGSTDIGYALNYSMDLLINEDKFEGNYVAILFSDGSTDLKYSNTGRTLADSKADEENAFEKAKDLKCPIYTIGLSNGGTINTDYLEKIAGSTKGKKYEIPSSDVLLDIFNVLFTDITGNIVYSADFIENSSGEEELIIPIPSKYAHESNIIIQHNGNFNITNSDEITTEPIYKSKKFTSIKLINSEANEITVKFTCGTGETIKVNTINFYDILPVIEMPSDLSKREVPIISKLYSTEGQIITDSHFYNNMDATLNIIDYVNGEVTQIPMENKGTYFEALYDNKAEREFDFFVTVIGENYKANSNNKKIAFTNTLPEKINDESVPVLKQNKMFDINLNTLFSDIDGDRLTYEIIETDSLETSIQNDTLLMLPDKTMKEEVLLRVSDERGGSIEASLSLTIMPFWLYYKNHLIGIAIIFTILLASYVFITRRNISEVIEAKEEKDLFPSTKFRGTRFEGYFLNTLSGKEIPALFWSASYIDNKTKVSLGELLSMMDVSEKTPEGYKIYFSQGNNNTVIFTHDTNCLVTFGNKVIESGNKTILKYDDKIYIVFEDHTTEIEIRYKRVRKLVRV